MRIWIKLPKKKEEPSWVTDIKKNIFKNQHKKKKLKKLSLQDTYNFNNIKLRKIL